MMMKASCKLELVKWKCLESRYYYSEFPPVVLSKGRNCWCCWELMPPSGLATCKNSSPNCVSAAIVSSSRTWAPLLQTDPACPEITTVRWQKGFFSHQHDKTISYLKYIFKFILQCLPFVISNRLMPKISCAYTVSYNTNGLVTGGLK